MKFFDKVLRIDSKNVYAVNGLAIALAENGYIQEARDGFTLVREANENIASAQLNLGHLLVDSGNFRSAIATVLFFNSLLIFSTRVL